MKRRDRIRKGKSLSSFIRWKKSQPSYMVELRLSDGSLKSVVLSEKDIATLKDIKNINLEILNT